MATLRIYADEAGRKSLSDDDGPFVAATVSILGAAPVLDDESQGHSRWFVAQLQKFKAIPFYTTIIPYPGFGRAMRGKLEQMDTMARANRLVTGATTAYLARDGYNLRNLVWSYSMQHAIHIAFLRAVARESVDQIEVIVDQQTLHPGLQQMLTDQIAGMKDRLVDEIEKIRHLDPSAANLLRSRCQTVNNVPTIKINNDPDPCDAECGLKLAHYLATFTFQDLRNPHDDVLASMLSGAGFTGFSDDCTEWATAPISPNAIAKWQAMTGLPVPSQANFSSESCGSLQ